MILTPTEFLLLTYEEKRNNIYTIIQQLALSTIEEYQFLCDPNVKYRETTLIDTHKKLYTAVINWKYEEQKIYQDRLSVMADKETQSEQKLAEQILSNL